MYALLETFERVKEFIDSGGPVLYWIAGLTFILWTLVFERMWFYNLNLKKMTRDVIRTWQAREEKRTWNARQIRQKTISEVQESIMENLPLIKTLVALCPLLGLLGTVTGMIEVFNVMAVTGGGEARAMASGVSRATIPTMAGMVAAISGVFAITLLTRVADRESVLIEDRLTMHVEESDSEEQGI